MAIVYHQEELIKALDEGCKEITLCAGIFSIRNASSVVFDRIGPVKVYVDCTAAQADELGLKFIDIYPSFKASYATEGREDMSPVSALSYGSYSSSYGSFTEYGGSFFTSAGSGVGKHFYEYEFSHRASLSGSYQAGYSFVASYSYSSSFSVGSAATVGSLKGSLCLSETKPDSMRVFGYGINLI